MSPACPASAPAGGSPCAVCAALGRTCCQLTPGSEEACFPLSEMEKDRILDAIPARGGFCLSPNSAAFMASMRRLFPGEAKVLAALFPPGGQHWRLATLPGGDCAFLTPQGCALPNEARPHYCRLFPFWVIDGDIAIFTASSCQAVKLGRDVPGTLAVFGLTRPRVNELFGRLRLAWGLPPCRGEGPELSRFPK